MAVAQQLFGRAPLELKRLLGRGLGRRRLEMRSGERPAPREAKGVAELDAKLATVRVALREQGERLLEPLRRPPEREGLAREPSCLGGVARRARGVAGLAPVRREGLHVPRC